jgi:hypothetical protein
MDRGFRSQSPFPRNRAFVVQLSADATTSGFVGRVEHVLSGKTRQFRSPRALLEFLKSSLTGDNDLVRAIEDERPL